MWKRMWKRFKTHVETIYTHVETIQNNLNKKVDNRPIIGYLLLPTIGGQDKTLIWSTLHSNNLDNNCNTFHDL